MADRVMLHAGPAAPYSPEWQLACGEWWHDGWITPTLAIRIQSVPPGATIFINGYAPGFAPRQIENAITLDCAGMRVTRSLAWGSLVELIMRLPHSVSGDVTLTIRIREHLEPDALDRRDRGIIISRILVRSDTEWHPA